MFVKLNYHKIKHIKNNHFNAVKCVIGTEFTAIGIGRVRHWQSTCPLNVEDLANKTLHKLASTCITFIFWLDTNCFKM